MSTKATDLENKLREKEEEISELNYKMNDVQQHVENIENENRSLEISLYQLRQEVKACQSTYERDIVHYAEKCAVLEQQKRFLADSFL